jgi:hypothetical protein
VTSEAPLDVRPLQSYARELQTSPAR